MDLGPSLINPYPSAIKSYMRVDINVYIGVHSLGDGEKSTLLDESSEDEPYEEVRWILYRKKSLFRHEKYCRVAIVQAEILTPTFTHSDSGINENVLNDIQGWRHCANRR